MGSEMCIRDRYRLLAFTFFFALNTRRTRPQTQTLCLTRAGVSVPHATICSVPLRDRTGHVIIVFFILGVYIFFRANDSTGYTLVEPRHIRVPFVHRHYTHAADWPAPHFTLTCRGSARVYPVILCPKLYPAAPDLYPDQTGNRRKYDSSTRPWHNTA